MIFKKQASEQQHFARKCCCFFVRSFLKHTIFTPKVSNKNAGADIIRPFFIGNCLYLTPQIFDLVGGRYAVQTITLLYKYNPISFGKPKETGLRPERKVFYPLLFAPANAVPFQKGTKMLHRMNSISNIDRCRSESATVFILSFWLNHITAAKKERLLPYEINGCLFFIYITDLKDSLL